MRRSKIGFGLIFAAVIPLAVASTAWACGVLATLKLDTWSVSPGQSVTAIGVNYSVRPGVSPVTIHLVSRTGKVIANTVPGSGRGINTTFPIPANTKPGWYVIMATQYNANGTPVAGTPGRTTLRVRGSVAAHHAQKASAVSPWSSSKPIGPAGASVSVAHDAGGSNSPGALPMLLAVVLSLGLLGTGLTLAGRRSRSSRRMGVGI